MTLSGKSLILIGGGGHARTLVDALVAQGIKPAGYIDSNPQAWLDDQGVKSLSEIPSGAEVIVAFVGVTVEALRKRFRVMQDYQSKGAKLVTVIHPTAIVSKTATIGEGAQIGAGAIVHAYANIGSGAIINTSAVVEHDAKISAGAHVAPRAVVLGGASVGECAFIATQAVVVQGNEVPAGHFVKALSVY